MIPVTGITVHGDGDDQPPTLHASQSGSAGWRSSRSHRSTLKGFGSARAFGGFPRGWWRVEGDGTIFRVVSTRDGFIVLTTKLHPPASTFHLLHHRIDHVGGNLGLLVEEVLCHFESKVDIGVLLGFVDKSLLLQTLLELALVNLEVSVGLAELGE